MGREDSYGLIQNRVIEVLLRNSGDYLYCFLLNFCHLLGALARAFALLLVAFALFLFFAAATLLVTTLTIFWIHQQSQLL